MVEFKLKFQSGKARFGSKSALLSRVTLQFDGWHWKTMGHLFHTTSSFVHHFTAMGKFKLELQSRNAQFGSKSAFFVPCDLEIRRMTSKNNRAPLLCCFKLCASFHSHQWIKTRVTVRKRPIWVKIDVFCPMWPWNMEIWQMTLKKNRATSSFVHHFIAIAEFIAICWSYSPEMPNLSQNRRIFSCVTLKFDWWPWKTLSNSPKQHKALCIIASSCMNSNWSYGPETAKLVVDLCYLDLWPLTLTFCMDVTSVIGDNSWKFHDDTMMVT